MKKVLLLFVISLLILGVFSQENEFFLYVPTMEEMQNFFGMSNFLSEWEEGSRVVDDENFGRLYQNYIGEDTLDGLVLESFFRNTTNKDIQQQLKKYISTYKIETSFAKAMLKKIDSKIESRMESNREVIRYVYNDSEYDENINLFDFQEVGLFENNLSLLLFYNDWAELSFNSGEKNNKVTRYTLLHGGGTNFLTIGFEEIKEFDVKDLDVAMKHTFYEDRYPGNWQNIELEQQGILWNCGADIYTIGFGRGPDLVHEIDSATFNTYLYKEKDKTLYVVNTSMNFSQKNIFYTERTRIFNLLLFYTLF